MADPPINQFYERLQSRLTQRQYLALQPPGGLIQRAFLRPAGTIADTRLIGVIDAQTATESPAQMFEHVKDWYVRTIPAIRGEGLLIFVYAPALAKVVEQIKKAAFYAGSISVAACAYDLTDGSHWFSYSGAWEDEVFGSS